MSIKSIAIIGGGPGGLVTLNEFLSTSADGQTTVHGEDGERPTNPAFDKVVLFEQKDRAGGVWATDIEHADSIPAEVINTKEYFRKDVINPKLDAPTSLENTSAENPVQADPVDNSLQWRISGVYPNLYSNVPRRFLRFSSIKEDPEAKEKVSLDPLIRYQEIEQLLIDFIKNKQLKDHIRVNTQVQNVTKDPATKKWTLTLRRNNKETGKDEWYTETFDAVAVSSGHYSVPFIPYVEGLETRNPSSFIHSKSFRDPNDFKDQNVIVVGSSLSGIDIVQYINKLAKNLYISRTPNKDELFPWLTRAANSLNTKPKIQKIDNKTVYFTDGSHLDDIDKIIFASGYHWSYQYLPEEYFEISKEGYGNESTGFSRVRGLYLDTFNIQDPTLGFVGINLTSVKFHTLETSAAALAGVWSKGKELPSKEDQIKWEQDRLAKTADNAIFHYYPWDVVKADWIDHVIKYAPNGRKNPVEGEYITDFDKAFSKAEEIFFDFKEQKGNYDYLDN